MVGELGRTSTLHTPQNGDSGRLTRFATRPMAPVGPSRLTVAEALNRERRRG